MVFILKKRVAIEDIFGGSESAELETPQVEEKTSNFEKKKRNYSYCSLYPLFKQITLQAVLALFIFLYSGMRNAD